MSPTGQIPILTISLPDALARRAAFAQAMDALGLTFEFVDAIDGRAGLSRAHEARVDRARARRQLGRGMTDAELACALSHSLAYERMLAGPASHALILEDDAIPLPALRTFLAGNGAEAAPLVLLYHQNARVRTGSARVIGDGLSAHDLAIPCFGAVAYSVSRAAAEFLRDRNTPVAHTADWPGDITRINAAVVLPAVVDHPEENPSQSTLTPSGRTRQRPRMSRFLNPRYLRRVVRKLNSEKVS